MFQSVHPGGPLWNDDLYKSEVGHFSFLTPRLLSWALLLSPLVNQLPLLPNQISDHLIFLVAIHCGGFVLQCRLAFYCAPTTYSFHVAKITFVISALKGEALRWAHSYLTTHKIGTLTFSQFESFLLVFNHPRQQEEAAERLLTLRQGNSSVAEHALRFRTTAATFLLGSTQHLKNGVLTHHPLNLYLCRLVALALDQRRDGKE